MLETTGKFDCTRIRRHLRRGAARIVLFVTIFGLFRSWALAQTPTPPQYPEIGWLAHSSYCNPYFGFRLTLPTEFKSEPIYLPVQPVGHHMLFASRLRRLDRDANILISAFEDSSDEVRSEDSAHLAAKARVLQSRAKGLFASGPNALNVHENKIHRLRIAGDSLGSGDETSYYFFLRGHVIHVAIFAHDPRLAAAIESAVEHLEFVDHPESCSAQSAPVSPKAMASHSYPSPSELPHLYYGPALPTELVETTLRRSPGKDIPDGQFSQGTFADPALALHVALPPGWQPLPNHEAYRVVELMRDPTDDPESSDRRRVLFRACSRVLFTAADPATELIPEVHPTLAVIALPQGCIPDLVPPSTPDDPAGLMDFSTLLVRSLGTPLLRRGSSYSSPTGRPTFDLDGTIPYQLHGEKLSRRLSLRVSATAAGPWIILVYSVSANPAALHDLESRITIGTPVATVGSTSVESSSAQPN